ncbi:RICIN domain-containing protein [Mangrovihabitans endophyticus]|uniref:Ricin B lectin domain-containing protein n=1 Tax=Mangrovihabitans endophyticus TaxID=1751298 RepID=A0A8J3C022_9ACTN|nr:RICIN domain-containing protein [Mangrovihabitans endophyticus]GGK95860.1 hypothetical protein GCM10012284_32520 [Mangrovihabitans endophyticus]
MALGTALALAVLTGAGGFVARQAAQAAEPLQGSQLSGEDVRILDGAAAACPALTPARLAGQVMVASHFGNQPVAEMRGAGASGVAALTPVQWQQNAPWPDAKPTDREAAVTALAHLMCGLIGQARAVRVKEGPWRVALAAYRTGMDKVVAANRIPDEAKEYVDTVARYANWYALQPTLSGDAPASRPAGEPGVVRPVPDAYVTDVAAAGKVCTDMPPARVAAQLMVTSGFDPDRLGPAGEQGIAQFTPKVWKATVKSAEGKSPWDPSVAIRALGRAMCELIEHTGGQYASALAAFAQGDEAASVVTLADAVTKAEAEYAKDERLQAPKASATSSPAAPAEPEPEPAATTENAEPAPPERDNQPAVKADDASGSSYGPYFLLNFATKMCVDVPGRGAGDRDGPVNQSHCAKTYEDNQEWSFEPRAADDEGFQLYWIRNADDGFCIDPPTREAVASGTELDETGCFDQDNQYFRLEPKQTSDGFAYYWLRNTVADMCLDVPGPGNGGADIRLALVPCLDNDDHEWALVEKSEW